MEEKTEIIATEKTEIKIRGKNGGARKGAGKPKGPNKKPIEVKIAEEIMRQSILVNLEPILNAQFSLAKGHQMLFRLDPEYKTDSKGKRYESGKKSPVLVEDPEEIREFISQYWQVGEGAIDDKYYFISAQKPENSAINSLIDRVFGKVRQNIGVGDTNGNPLTIQLSEFIAQKNDIT